MADRLYKGDTAVIEANLYDEDGTNTLTATAVEWNYVKPDGTLMTGGPVVVDQTSYDVAISDTNIAGPYTVQITYTLTDTTKRSTVTTFEVIDPLETTTEGTSDKEIVVDRAWMKLEDCFDSELGGPHLRDRTLAMFDKDKMQRLLPDALYYINNEYQPSTTFDDTSFPYAQHGPLLTQSLLVESIYHLMRSYVEQPDPRGGGNITYFDRRDYLQRWTTILAGEEKKLLTWLDLFKRDQMGFGNTSILIGGYSGWPKQPRYMRGRYPFIPRY